MNKEKLRIHLENCTKCLEGFASDPLKNLEELLLYLDSLQGFLVKADFPYLLEKVEKISNILLAVKKYLNFSKYLDPNLMEELAFFLNGALLDFSSHMDDIKEKDLESLKNTHWQKILFLKDWVSEFLKLPEISKASITEQYEKFILFFIGHNLFTLPISSFKEMVMLEKEEEIMEGGMIYQNKKIAIIDRNSAFGESNNKFPKTMLIFNQNNLTLALEIDQLGSALNLNIKEFDSIEVVAGIGYEGPIEYITIFENKPLFILNPQSSALRPLTT
jgi:chemotaxis signal transduction protein